MSYTELNDWDPMEEHYRKDDFGLQTALHSVDDEHDELCLYFKNVPADLTEHMFHSMMSEGGRTVTDIMLNKKLYPESNITYGFVHFASQNDAVSALNAWNNCPPYHFRVSFARKRNDDRKAKSGSINMNHNESFSTHLSSVPSFGSKGRGTRIDLDGNKTISRNIKVIRGGNGRTVTMDNPDPVQKNVESPSSMALLKNPGEERSPYSENTPINGTNSDCITPKLVANPFYLCFHCKKEAKMSCGNCKKPYCSKGCQTADWHHHQFLCKVAAGVSSSLMESFKIICTSNHDSSYMSEGSSSDCETHPGNVSERVAKSCRGFVSPNQPVINAVSPTSSPNSEKLIHPKRLPLLKAVEPATTKLSPGQPEKVLISHIESPAKFWVQLQKFSSALLELEQNLSNHHKTSLSGDQANCYCCVEYKNNVYRGRLLKDKSVKAATVYLLDYGETVLVTKKNLFELPEQFRKFPTQGVCCKLVDSEKRDIQWNNEDVLSFKLHAKNPYKAILLKTSGDVNEVSLINEDGNNLYSILVEEKNTESVMDNVPSVDNDFLKDSVPPSIWSKIKLGTLMKILPVYSTENIICCYLFNNNDDLQEVAELEILLKDYSNEDFSKCAEEGDFVAGFSPIYQQFYRCVVLKRRVGSFLVRYIDYGNEEEVTQLTVLSPELVKKCSYVVKCEKPTHVSVAELESSIKPSAVCKVNRLEKSSMQLLCHVQGKDIILRCHPCYELPNTHLGNTTKTENTTKQLSSVTSPKGMTVQSCSVKSETTTVQVRELTSPNPPKDLKPAVPQMLNPIVRTERVLQPKQLSSTDIYKINVVYIKTVSEMFVQFTEEEPRLNMMTIELNKYCNSKKSPYVPKIGEVVCSKHSDDFWYRGLVKRKMNDIYNVLYVDYGEENNVMPKDIQCLPDKFICQKYSICVSLFQVKDQDVTKSLINRLLKESWDMKIVDNTKSPPDVMLFSGGTSFTSLIEKEKRNIAILKKKKLPSGIPVKVKITHEDEIFLYVVQVDDIKTVEEMAFKLRSLTGTRLPPQIVINNVYCGLFKQDGLWYRVTVLEKVSADMYKVLFLDYGNCEIIFTNDMREITDELFTMPVNCIPVKTQNREGLDLNLKDEYTVEVVEDVAGIQEVKFVGLSEFSKMSSLKKRQLAEGLNEVRICHFECDTYYCQLSSDNDAIIEIISKLRKFRNQVSTCSTKLHVGDVITALSCDGNWYRASVVDDKSYPTYEVIFFDYGIKGSVHKDNIKALPTELLNYPVFSMPIKIKNIEVANKDTSIFTGCLQVMKIDVTDNQVSIVEIQIEDENTLPKISSLLKMALPTHSSSKVNLCHLEDGIMYVQLASNADKLDKLSSSLQEAPNFKDLFKLPEENDILCVKRSDDQWYRGYVQEVLCDSKTIKVSFFDFGFFETVSLDNVKILPSEFNAYPILSVPVIFSDINALEEALKEDIILFDVKVIDTKGDIQVIEICKALSAEVPVENIYQPFYLSDLKRTTLSLTQVYKILFIHCTGDSYYAFKSEDSNVMETIKTHLQDTTPEAISHTPSIAEVLLCRRSDNQLYRGCVDIFYTERNVGTVHFIDLGVTEDIPKKHMYCLSEIFKTFPIFVMKVRVQTDTPVFLKKRYHARCIKQIANETLVLKVYHQYMFASVSRRELPVNETRSVACCYGEKGRFFVQDVSDVELIAEVHNLLIKCNNGCSIPYNPSVGELVCAKSELDSSWYRGCVEEMVASDQYKIFFIDYGNCEIVKTQDLQCISSDLVKIPSLCIPVTFSSSKDAESIEIEKVYAVQAESTPIKNLQTVKLVVPEDKESSKDVDNKIKSADVNSSSELFPFKYSLCKYIPFNAGEQNIAIYSVCQNTVFCGPFNKEDIAANIQLSAEITAYCSTQGISVTADCVPEPDDMVLAKFSEDEQWYRAVVIDKSPPRFDCLFVDYGNIEQVHPSNLKRMEKQFMELPIQAHKCSLSGFVSSEENLPKVHEELKNFTIFSCPEPLKAHVEIKDDEYFLNIPRITEHLVGRQLAVTAD